MTDDPIFVPHSIIDDGLGFAVPTDANELASAGAYGLLGMQERAALHRGSLGVKSDPELGTVVTLMIAPESAGPTSALAEARISA